MTTNIALLAIITISQIILICTFSTGQPRPSMDQLSKANLGQCNMSALDQRELERYTTYMRFMCENLSGLLFWTEDDACNLLYRQPASSIKFYAANTQRDIIESKHPCTSNLLEHLRQQVSSITNKTIPELIANNIKCNGTALSRSFVTFIFDDMLAKSYLIENGTVKYSGKIERLHSATIIMPSNRTFFVEQLRRLMYDVSSVIRTMSEVYRVNVRLIFQIQQTVEEDPLLTELNKYSLIVNGKFSKDLLETVMLSPQSPSRFERIVIVKFSPQKTIISAVVLPEIGVSDGEAIDVPFLWITRMTMISLSKLTNSTFIQMPLYENAVVIKNGNMTQEIDLTQLADFVVKINTPPESSQPTDYVRNNYNNTPRTTQNGAEKAVPRKVHCDKLTSFQRSLFDSLQSFSVLKVGALVIVQDEDDAYLEKLANNARILDAEYSSYLFEAIFNKDSPLHDGAMLITVSNSGIIIHAAGLVIPIEENESALNGTRHHAAAALSRKSNAFILIVSEETGRISEAVSGATISTKSIKQLEKDMSNRLQCSDNDTDGDNASGIHIGIIHIVIGSSIIFVLIVAFVPKKWLITYLRSVPMF